MRRSSWLFAAKCFGVAAVPSDWMPRTNAAASLPARYGSSEKYSKLRPASGLRLMLRPGPSSTSTSCAAASAPSALPTSSASDTSQLLATVAEVGKQVAGWDSPSPSLS